MARLDFEGVLGKFSAGKRLSWDLQLTSRVCPGRRRERKQQVPDVKARGEGAVGEPPEVRAGAEYQG